MSQHLFDRPNSIEELTEQREYINSIPEKVTENQVSVIVFNGVKMDYSILAPPKF